jgi:hypothetical protein
MKTLKIFLLCLFMGIGVTQLSAQPAIGKSGTVIVDEIMSDFYEEVPLNCDYNTIGVLVGTVRAHSLLHYTNFDGNLDNYDWIRQIFHGELVLEATNEIFKVSDIITAKGPNGAHPGPGHFNVIGNQGSHYIVTYLWDGNINFVSVKCPGGK